MQKNRYKYERDGQIEFFDAYGIDYRNEPVLAQNTDGIYHGNLLEFKLSINNTDVVLSQAIKYLSHLRISGQPVPSRILLIDLNGTTVYEYASSDYQDFIECPYSGAASKDNDTFHGHAEPKATYDYANSEGLLSVMQLLVNKPADGDTEAIYNGNPASWYLPVHIDENCIVGYASTYYANNAKATKASFVGRNGEIRKPKFLKGVILPYEGQTNERFAYLMDCLNDRLHKKSLGAFYTPPAYAKKAAELVKRAIDGVPDGNDYVIIDRCAGTGNLEEALVGLHDRNGDEVVSHCIISTLEYFEYKVLSEKLGDKVRAIIPSDDKDIVFKDGKIANADAMSQEYVTNAIVKRYVDDPHCTIIMLENPPYRDTGSNSSDGISGNKQDCFVLDEMVKDGVMGVKLRELSTRFIWSAWHHYLRDEHDSYVVFSPVKYFKMDGLCDKECVDGFLLNRKHFHATESSISCILWKDVDADYDDVTLHAYDIDGKGETRYVKDVIIRKVHEPSLNRFYDQRAFPDDETNGIRCNLDGTERTSTHGIAGTPLYNRNIVAYIRASSSNFDPLSRQLLRCEEYDAKGFFVRDDNVLNALPLWVAKNMPMDDWYEKGIYVTSADGKDAYKGDADFLKSCLIYACLSNQNKCLSMTGSDGRFYRNELCLDTTNGDTVASTLLHDLSLDDDEEELIENWHLLLRKAQKVCTMPSTPAGCVRKCELTQSSVYDSRLTYGVYQITRELNTSYQVTNGRNAKTVYDHPMLNTYLTTIRTLLKQYYLKHIKGGMFRYELVK